MTWWRKWCHFLKKEFQPSRERKQQQQTMIRCCVAPWWKRNQTFYIYLMIWFRRISSTSVKNIKRNNMTHTHVSMHTQRKRKTGELRRYTVEAQSNKLFGLWKQTRDHTRTRLSKYYEKRTAKRNFSNPSWLPSRSERSALTSGQLCAMDALTPILALFWKGEQNDLILKTLMDDVIPGTKSENFLICWKVIYPWY